MNDSKHNIMDKFTIFGLICFNVFKIVFVIGIVALYISIIVLYATLIINNVAVRVNTTINKPAYDDAYERGMTEDDKNLFTYSEIAELNEITPISEELPDDTSGILVVLYKYGSDYCNAIFEDLTDTIEGYENSYVAQLSTSISITLRHRQKTVNRS